MRADNNNWRRGKEKKSPLSGYSMCERGRQGTWDLYDVWSKCVMIELQKSFQERDEPWIPADVRLWRFIASGPALLGVLRPTPARLFGVERDPGSWVGIVLVVEARGRVDDDAILGNAEPPLRDELLGAPDARFLFLMTSVFNDSGRTTPCNL